VSYPGYALLKVARAGKIVTATVANPPMNLITGELIEELDRFTTEVAADPEPLVVVLRSSTPGFFVAHARYGDLDKLKAPRVPASRDEVSLNVVHRISKRLSTMDKVTIAQVEGRATGGGAALAMTCDLRYGAVGQAVFNSFGVPVGTGLGGGATQYLPRLVGRSRAMEVILAGLDLDAVTAERWGYLTRALEPDAIGDYVDGIARRIASCSPAVIRHTKELIAADLPLTEGLRDENFRLQQLMVTDEAIAGIRSFLELGGETPEGESRIGDLLGELLEKTGR
jgi:enoyl-CoA hydratase/carnithine racemase